MFQIDEAISALADPETGELLDYEAFDALQMERGRKIENIALWAKDLLAAAKALKEEADALTERRKAAEAKADRLKGYLDMALDGQRFETARCVVSFRKSTALEVSDPAALVEWAEQNGYDECVRYKDPEVSKSAVASLVKSGVPVPFASLEERRSVGVK